MHTDSPLSNYINLKIKAEPLCILQATEYLPLPDKFASEVLERGKGFGNAYIHEIIIKTKEG
jgi:hypothetical protein